MLERKSFDGVGLEAPIAQPLFSAEDLAICRKRLKQYEYVRK
jgi:hypothetical protein